jgi:hypothetical protein
LKNEETESGEDDFRGLVGALSNTQRHFLGLCCFYRSFRPAGDYLLEQVSNLQPDNGLEETSSVVTAGEIGMLQHLLGDFSIELGRDVA